MPCVHIDEFGVGETFTLKPTDVFGTSPLAHRLPWSTLSCSPELMGRKSGDTASETLEGFTSGLFPGPAQRPVPYSLSPITENKFVLFWGTEEHPHFILVEKDALSSPGLPLWGERSLDPVLHPQVVTLRVLLVSSWCSVFPGQGEVGGRNLGWGRGC